MFHSHWLVGASLLCQKKKMQFCVWVKKRSSFFLCFSTRLLFTVAENVTKKRIKMKCWLCWLWSVVRLHCRATCRFRCSADHRHSGYRIHWILLMNYWWCRLQWGERNMCYGSEWKNEFFIPFQILSRNETFHSFAGFFLLSLGVANRKILLSSLGPYWFRAWIITS